MNVVFGREFDKKNELSSTLDEYKDMMLFFLEDFLFHFKLEPKNTYISIPAFGFSSVSSSEYIPRSYLYLPQISFDDYGCLYTNEDDSAYISPEFFAKCFLQRVVDVHNAFFTLNYPYIVMKKNKDDEKDKSFPFLPNFKSHVDFIKIYDEIVEQKRKNSDLTKGLIGIVPDLQDRNYITILRKIQVAAQVQRDIEYIIEKIKKQEFDEMLFEYSNDDFYQSDEFKKLEDEHRKLFRSGSFFAPMEMPEWDQKNWNYDEGTDEERNAWRTKYNKIKHAYYKVGIIKIKMNINKKIFPINYINKEIIDYLKEKIYTNKGNQYGYIDKFGLDETAYYSHPTDKYIPELLSNKKSIFDGDISSNDYDEFYEQAEEHIENNNNDKYHK